MNEWLSIFFLFLGIGATTLITLTLLAIALDLPIIPGNSRKAPVDKARTNVGSGAHQH